MKLRELLDNALTEVFDTKAKMVWTKKDNIFETEFSLDDRTYIIYIEYFNFAELGIFNIENAYEISFTGKDINTNNASYKATGTNTKHGHNIKVFSIVKNSVQEKIKNLSYDLLFFDAKNTDEYYTSRVSLYQMISSLLRKTFNLSLFSKDYSQKFHLFILSKTELDEEDVDRIINLINN